MDSVYFFDLAPKELGSLPRNGYSHCSLPVIVCFSDYRSKRASARMLSDGGQVVAEALGRATANLYVLNVLISARPCVELDILTM